VIYCGPFSSVFCVSHSHDYYLAGGKLMRFCNLYGLRTKSMRSAAYVAAATIAFCGSGIPPALALTHTESAPEALAYELDLAAQPELVGSPLLRGVHLGMSGLEIIQVLSRNGYECDFDYGPSLDTVVCTRAKPIASGGTNLGDRITISNKWDRHGYRREIDFKCGVFGTCSHDQIALTQQLIERFNILEARPVTEAVLGVAKVTYCGATQQNVELCVEPNGSIILGWTPAPANNDVNFD